MKTNLPMIQIKRDPTGGSDQTLKRDVASISGALAKILALRPVTWFWKEKRDGENRQFGFIAQEVERIMPDAVSEGAWNDGTTRKFIDTTDMLPYLVAAIKEQQDQIAQLQKQMGKQAGKHE